jgi:hypothetical protein
MKSLFSSTIFMLSLSAFAQTTPSQPPAPPTASSPAAANPDLAKIKAVLISGNVTLQDSSGEHPLTLGTIFAQGANLTVGAGQSQAGVAFSNGAFVLASANTSLSITNFEQAPYPAAISGAFLHLASPDPGESLIHLTLPAGTLLMDIKHMNLDEGSYLRINTPLGSFVFSPALFRISVSAPTGPNHDTSVIVDCLKGGVTCFPNGEIRIGAGFVLNEGQEYALTGNASSGGLGPTYSTSVRALTPAEITRITNEFLQAQTAALAN